VALVNILLVLLAALAFLLPFSPFIALGWWLYRRRQRRKPERTPLLPPPPMGWPPAPEQPVDAGSSLGDDVPAS
jgi:hypothetical protein